MKNITLKNVFSKKAFVFGLALLASVNSFAQDNSEQIAFPGAEGWGRFATGGRATDPSIGSNVYHVTTLEDYTSSETPIEGSLRWALTDGDDTPRTILFKVAGNIVLKERLRCPRSNVTIAGQSAPGGGICISGANMYIHSKNYIVRYIRFRPGDLTGTNFAAINVENAQNIIIDHCSFSWSMEENVTMYDNKYTTMQYCILSEPLYVSKHDKGARGYGAQWGGEHSTYHHNIFAHCVRRTPLVNGARDKAASGHDAFVDSEIVNNVLFNWADKGALYGGDIYSIVEGSYCHTYLINNYYKVGPATNTFQERWFADCSYDATNASKFARWYIKGNQFETNEYKNDKNKGDHSEVNADNWIYANTTNSKRAVNLRAGATNYENIMIDAPTASSGLIIESAYDAYLNVIANAGANLPRVDAVDERILKEAAGLMDIQDRGAVKWNKTVPAVPEVSWMGILNSQDDLKPENADENWTPWPDLSMKEGESLPVDSDGDGIPDTWEEANNLDKTNAEDGALIASNGYSNLENYLNSIGENSGGNTGITNTPNYLNEMVKSYTITNSMGQIVFNSQAGVMKSDIQLPSILQTGIYIVVYNYENGLKSSEKKIF